MERSYYLKLLKEHLDRKQRANTKYSLRAFARDIEVHPSTLSAVLKGTRTLPYKDAQTVSRKLRLSPQEETLFIESLLRVRTKLDEITIPRDEARFMLDESHYQVIAEWEHYAVLALFDVDGFEVSEPAIASKLGITESRAESVLGHLLACGLIRQESNGSLVRVHTQVRTTEDVKNKAIHEGHREALELGLKKLDEVSVDTRDFSEVVLAVDPEKLGEAKAIIREFRQKMGALMKTGQKTEVYQLAIQLFPMTVQNINNGVKS